MHNMFYSVLAPTKWTVGIAIESVRLSVGMYVISDDKSKRLKLVTAISLVINIFNVCILLNVLSRVRYIYARRTCMVYDNRIPLQFIVIFLFVLR